MVSTVGSPTAAELTARRVTGALGRDVSAALPRPAGRRAARDSGKTRAWHHAGAASGAFRAGHPLRGAPWAYRLRPSLAARVNRCAATDSIWLEFVHLRARARRGTLIVIDTSDDQRLLTLLRCPRSTTMATVAFTIRNTGMANTSGRLFPVACHH